MIVKEIGDAFTSYTFTDISTGFFERAQDDFKRFGNKFIFKALDCEKDIEAQGFIENSYDLVIASLVLHATECLEKTLKNVRRLLKPGGFLLMLEFGSDGPMRFGFCMSGLPGWWLGHNDGRILSPCITSSQWHTALQASGFSGVDAITPEVDTFARPGFVIASQAVDERVNTLCHPLQVPSSAINMPELVILGGTKLQTARLADNICRILKPWCHHVIRFSSIEKFNSIDVLPKSTFLILTELDKPFFKSVTSDKIEALKQVLNKSSMFLWVTQGSRTAQPYSSISTGFGRTLGLEMPHIRTQYLDLDPSERPAAELISKTLLQLHITDVWESEDLHNQVMWSTEPEIAQEAGNIVVPRLRHIEDANARYNSSVRKITQELRPQTSPLSLCYSDEIYTLRNETCSIHQATNMESVLVAVECSLLFSIKVASAGYYFVVYGKDVETGSKVFGLSDSLASFVNIPKRQSIPCEISEGQEDRFMRFMFHELVATVILSLSSADKTVLIQEPDPTLASILEEYASDKGVSIVFATANQNLPAPWVYIHPASSQRVIKSVLPDNVSCFIHLSVGNEQQNIVSNISNCLSPHCERWDSRSLFQRDSNVRQGAAEDIHQMLQWGFSRWQTKHAELSDTTLPSIVTLRDILEVHKSLRPTTVVNWTIPETVPVLVEPVDSKALFKSDRTYILFGLTSDLAQTLCHWMVAHGARYVVMTSRSPKVQPAWIAQIEAMGATIRIFARYF
jgi:hybrid polyketide synthase/nonribosomal peptide synthetase ACE1